jgi:hypothetical protein
MAPPDIKSVKRLRVSFTAPENDDDLSSNGHRMLLGVLGLLLPGLLYLVAGSRPLRGKFDSWALLDSISGYYHSGAEAVFIGVVVATGLFLLTYDGYGNDDGWKDRLSARIAGTGALVLAFYPTAVEGGYPHLCWWQPYMGKLHSAGATVLFGSFAYMSYFLFPITQAEPDAARRRRNGLHRACGIVIVAGLAWAGIAGFVYDRPIFWPETLMLAAFGTSWLAKGKAVEAFGTLRQQAAARWKGTVREE